jgi:hypothetical protein
MLEADGEWVSAFANGRVIGSVRRISASTTNLQAVLEASAVKASTQATVTNVLLEALQPFLM